ncbi:MAG: YtxH domain-containing protein [Candidatus Aminicenantes bacterium]|nr:YtxH domain-containing protein [Candidatus Aminicenantes bacterium]
MSERKGSSLETFFTFLLGTVTGFALGILFAPASGQETRKKLKEEMVKSSEKAKEGYGKITKEAEKGIKVVREKTQEGIGAIKDFLDKKKEDISKKTKDYPE